MLLFHFTSTFVDLAGSLSEDLVHKSQLKQARIKGFFIGMLVGVSACEVLYFGIDFMKIFN